MIKKTVYIISTLLLFVFLFLELPTISVLAIYSRKNPHTVFYSRSAKTQGFCISYTHSVNKGRVHDYYLVTDDNKLKMDRTVFVSYGAGIPEPEETPGASFQVTESGYEISNLNRVVPQLVMAVGIIANHSLAIGNNIETSEEHFLTDFFEPQTSIILKIKRISILKYIFHKINL
ncbi:MAG: DUF1850 domain-containing protein [Treponema sp.]|nr:DUF1850 domain-containing protein [Treponema sp.]